MSISNNKDLYVDPAYDSFPTNYTTTTLRDYGTAASFWRGILVLFLRAGFICIQIASIPTSNVYLLIFYNLLDMAVASVVFGLLGYMFSFGGDNAFIGFTGSLFADKPKMDNFILGWCTTTTAAALITTCLAGRVNLIGFFLIYLLFASIIHPLLIHWIWSEYGFLTHSKLGSFRVAIKDYSGCYLIHVIGSCAGLVGIIFLGRRVKRLRDIHENSLAHDAPGICIIGYFLIIVGLISFGVPTPYFEITHLPGNYIGMVMVNNVLAIAGSMTIVFVLNFVFYKDNVNYWVLLRCCQASVAGIVTISAGVDVFRPLIAFILSIIGGLVFFFCAQCITYSSLEDYCNIIPIHLVCGILGTILPALFGNDENLGLGTVKFTTMAVHLGWQLISLLCCLAVILVTFIIIFLLLRLCKILRNTQETEDHATAMKLRSKFGKRTYLQRIFPPRKDSIVIVPGDYSKKIAFGEVNANPKTVQNWFFPPEKKVKSNKPNDVSEGAYFYNRNKDDKLKIPVTMESDIKHLKLEKPKSPIVVTIPKEFSLSPEYHSKFKHDTQNITKLSISQPHLEFHEILSIRNTVSDSEITKKVKSFTSQRHLHRPWVYSPKVKLPSLKTTKKGISLRKTPRKKIPNQYYLDTNKKIHPPDKKARILKRSKMETYHMPQSDAEIV